MKDKLRAIVAAAVERCFADGTLTSATIPAFVIEPPASASHGDFASNVALTMAKGEKKAPRAVAEAIASRVVAPDLVERVEIAGPGFLNFFLSASAWGAILLDVAGQCEKFGRSGTGNGAKVQVEFVSANPTGPLHVGHGRGAAVGDVLCRLLEATGWDVTREFYYNDAGAQISNLALSVQARCAGVEPGEPTWPADGYQGEYIREIARAYLAREKVDADDRHVVAKGDPGDLDAIREFAVAYLRREQDLDLKAFGVGFDVFTLESSLYTRGKVDAVVQRLVDGGFAYEAEGALWLRTTDFGDDKDRVMRKADGSYTYFVPDVAYHLDKWERGFARVVNEQGADHHSTVTRVRAGLQALGAGIPTGWPEYVLHQMVTVMRGGEEVKISKRAGSYVTLRDLIDEVGRDATRYFFIMRRADAQLVFDIDLAKTQSNDNPVYYVQYAHARICSIFENAADKGFAVPSAEEARLDLLGSPEEIELLRNLGAFPETIERSAREFEPHIVTYYLQNLAGSFHSFYNRNRVITDDSNLTGARLFLLQGVATVLKNGLNLLGISAPERM